MHAAEFLHAERSPASKDGDVGANVSRINESKYPVFDVTLQTTTLQETIRDSFLPKQAVSINADACSISRSGCHSEDLHLYCMTASEKVRQ